MDRSFQVQLNMEAAAHDSSGLFHNRCHSVRAAVKYLYIIVALLRLCQQRCRGGIN